MGWVDKCSEIFVFRIVDIFFTVMNLLFYSKRCVFDVLFVETRKWGPGLPTDRGLKDPWASRTQGAQVAPHKLMY